MWLYKGKGSDTALHGDAHEMDKAERRFGWTHTVADNALFPLQGFWISGIKAPNSLTHGLTSASAIPSESGTASIIIKQACDGCACHGATAGRICKESE